VNDCLRPKAATITGIDLAQSSVADHYAYIHNASASGAKLTNGINPVINRLFNDQGVTIA
jgi:hypothetical protein